MGKSPLEDSLLEDSESFRSKKKADLFSVTVNLFATTVGACMLSLPLSLDYAGLWLGSAMVLFFGLVSDRSLIYLVRSARITGSASYYECGVRCLGAVGAKAVLVSLGALMFAAGVTVHIILTDIVHVLLPDLLGPAAEFARTTVAIGVTVLCVPLCMPRELQQLRWVSSASVCTILLACASVFAIYVRKSVAGGAPYAAAGIVHVRLSPIISLAIPIQSLAFCNQFSVLELQNELPAALKRRFHYAVHAALGSAALVYVAFGCVGYLLLGSRVAEYPNVLTAFAADRIVAAGAAGVAFTNLMKFPLVVLPLRSLIAEQLGQPRLSVGRHVAATAAMVVVIGAVGTWFADLALAFQIAGCTTGVMVCFCLPALMYRAALRLQREVSPVPTALELAKQQFEEGCAVLMCILGVVCGVVSLAVLLSVKFDGSNGTNGVASG